MLDAAYAEYVTRADYEPGLRLAATAPNVVMLRTFSKAYGLAGLRIGWLFGPRDIVDVLNRVQAADQHLRAGPGRGGRRGRGHGACRRSRRRQCGDPRPLREIGGAARPRAGAERG